MKLVGDVIEIHTAPNSETTDQAEVHVRLTDTSQGIVQDRSSNLALIGFETAAAVEVSFPDQPLRQSIHQVLNRNCITVSRTSCDQAKQASR